MLRRNLRNTSFNSLFLTKPIRPFQKEIKEVRERLEYYGRCVFGHGFDNFLDRIKSGEEISIDSFGGDTEGETSSGKNKDEVIQSLIPPFVTAHSVKELLKSIARRLLFQNDDDPDDVAINTLTNIFYFKYSSFYHEVDVNIIDPERVINDISVTWLQSYCNLPLHLKYCFDYCSLFPRDYVIEVPLLLKLWMAQGFIADEDVGRRYFEVLLAGGFFEKVESDMLETTKCRMDSHAFALSAFTSGSRYVLLRSDGRNYIPWTFHVSCDFHLHSERQIPTKLFERRWRFNELIRSFLLPCQLKSKSDRGMIDPKKIYNIISPHKDSDEDLGRESVSDLLISKLEGLHALELHDLGIQSLPDYIDRLKHLRYLDVSRNPDIKLLPNSITNLFNLQTLKLSSCSGLRELPKDMKNLIHLRHLEIEGCYNLRYMPPHLGQLTNLQTLSQFVLNDDVRSAEDQKYCSQLKELGRLNSFRGELKIKNLSSILTKDGACKAAALSEKHLQSLTLEWGVGKGTSDQYESQLEDLKPHQNLKELSLNDYWGVNLSSWLHSGNHVQLIKLALRRCHKCKVFPNVHLPTLKSLVLDDMAALEYIEDLFRSLQELWLTELPELKGWREVEVHDKPTFSCLSKLIIQDCPKLVSMPLFPTLEEELMLDSTNLKPFQETLRMEKTQKNPVSPPLSKLKNPSLVDIEELNDEVARGIPFQETLTMEKTQKNPVPHPLSKLKNLSLVGIDELKDSIADEIPWGALTSLSVLKLDCLTNLDKLPSKLQQLTNLKELHIWRCKMTVLPEWIKDLQSLKKLAIWVCPYMESLPEEIDKRIVCPLPPSLETLEIEDCPTLLQRCQKKIGADWDKVKDIPNLLGQLSAGNRYAI
ncbi:hypothetical protein UlMin_007176 [Ulmus minor]